MATTVDASGTINSSYIKLYQITLSDDFTAGNLTPKLEQESCHLDKSLQYKFLAPCLSERVKFTNKQADEKNQDIKGQNGFFYVIYF